MKSHEYTDPNTMSSNGMYPTLHTMKTRNELIEEIVEDFNSFQPPINPNEKLRRALLRMSNASMDAVEVEEKIIQSPRGRRLGAYSPNEKIRGWNNARAASQEKREAWIK